MILVGAIAQASAVIPRPRIWPSVGRCMMRLSGLCVIGLFVLSFLALSPAAFAQHSSSSSGSSGGSSSSGGGGGSHSSSFGGSSSGATSSSHSSGGGSVSHASNAHTSNTPAASHVVGRETTTTGVRSTPELNGTSQARTQPEKRGFFSFIRHPFRKAEPKPVSDLRRRVCLAGSCSVCPVGQTAGKGGCIAAPVNTYYHRRYCSPGEIWSGGACILQTHFVDDCSWLRMSVDRQQRAMQSAIVDEQARCGAGSTQACSQATAARQSEEDLYRTLSERYRQCLQRPTSTYSRGMFYSPTNGIGLYFDPLSAEINR
jgi:hypothetical protein